MNSNNVSHNTEKIKQEVDHLQSKVERDLDRIENHLTPGQIIDDVIMGSEKRTLREQFDLMKDNPTGTTFLTMGMILLNQDQYGRTREEMIQEKVKDTKDQMVDKVQEVKEHIQGKAQELKEQVEDKVQDVKEKAREKTEEYKGKIEEQPEEAQAKIYDLKERAQTKAQDVPDFIRNNPYAISSLGLSLGFAFGGAFPPSASDDEEMTSEELGSKLHSFKDEFKKASKDSAHRIQNKFLDEVAQRIQSRKHPLS